MMFFNYWLGFFNETYLFLSVCAGLNLFYFRWGSFGEAINTVFALFFGTFLAVFPFFVAIFYNVPTNYEKIRRKDVNFLARFGETIVGLNFKRKGRLVMIHTVASYIRKFWLAYLVVFQQSSPVLCI